MIKQKIWFLFLLLMISIAERETIRAQQNTNNKNETIFIWGDDINLKMVEYVADLTKKENPKICYLPTASADNQDNIKYWERICNTLKLDTIILKVWVSSSEKNQSFEDILLNSDAIVVGGGNTLNMLGIWRAQGIDIMMKYALNKGIILAGGSAGSICWFENGITDSKPVNLSVVDGLGILPYSNCPHYSEEDRRMLYHLMILEKKIPFGYANDELAGILFKNGKAVEFISQSDKHNSYFVSVEKGKIKCQKLESKIILRKNALPENSYSSLSLNKKLTDLLNINGISAPLNAYMEIKRSLLNNVDIDELKKNQILNIGVQKIFIYNNKIAGVVNDAYIDSFGYGLWYFYNCNGIWTSMGEDIGGATVLESEITFREKAKIIMKHAEDNLNCNY